MKPLKFISFIALSVASVAVLSGCSIGAVDSSLDSFQQYGPKTFDSSYVDQTDKINSLDVPVVKTLDDVGADQYVLVTLDNSILGDAEDYQMLYSGDKKSVILMTKEKSLKLASTDESIVVEPNMDVVPDADVNGNQSGTDLSQWGIDRIDQQNLPLDGSYSYGNDGSGVTAYIVDSGIRQTHSDFTGRITNGFDTIGDGNSYSDCYGHGTHVAGIIGGTQYGVAKKVNIVPVRVFACSGSATGTNLLNGLNWIKANHPGGPAVINMSLGSSGVSSGWQYVVDDMVSSGFIVVVSAGNDTADACGYSPAFVPSSITVGSTTQADAISSFSNYGSCVDILAPGSQITSASYSSDNGSVSMSGTSMSAPHVAGAVARILSAQPSYTPSEVSNVLSTMSAKNVLTGLPSSTPNQLLHIDPQLVSSPYIVSSSAPPSPPKVLALNVMKVSGAPELHIYGEHAGSGVTGYTVYYQIVGGASPTIVQFSNPDLTQPLDLKLSNLVNDKTYDVWVTATSTSGTSSSSIVQSVNVAVK